MMFSIIATDYDRTVGPETLQRFIDSLKAQEFKDFEVIILHDGPRVGDLSQIDYSGLNIEFIDTMFRGNVWGHNLRTLGMLKAKGEYFINTNTDNVYYPNAFSALKEFIDVRGKEHKVFISDVRMMGMRRKPNMYGGTDVYYDSIRDYSTSIILTGIPPVLGNIDLMSLVAHRNVWEGILYWYDLRPAGDGVIYGDICHKFKYIHTGILIGEHY